MTSTSDPTLHAVGGPIEDWKASGLSQGAPVASHIIVLLCLLLLLRPLLVLKGLIIVKTHWLIGKGVISNALCTVAFPPQKRHGHNLVTCSFHAELSWASDFDLQRTTFLYPVFVKLSSALVSRARLFFFLYFRWEEQFGLTGHRERNGIPQGSRKVRDFGFGRSLYGNP